MTRYFSAPIVREILPPGSTRSAPPDATRASAPPRDRELAPRSARPPADTGETGRR